MTSRSRLLVCAVALALGLAALPLHHGEAQSVAINVTNDGQTGALDCQGGTANVTSDGNHLTLQNCATVNITGNYNVLDVGTPAVVNLTGNQNHVTWTRSARYHGPHLNDAGRGNSVS